MICHALWGQVFPQQDMAIFMLSVYYLLSKESLRLLPQWRSNLAVSASMLGFDLARLLAVFFIFRTVQHQNLIHNFCRLHFCRHIQVSV